MMTREEAIAILIRERDEDPFMRTEYREQIHEALNMAIKALEDSVKVGTLLLKGNIEMKNVIKGFEGLTFVDTTEREEKK